MVGIRKNYPATQLAGYFGLTFSEFEDLTIKRLKNTTVDLIPEVCGNPVWVILEEEGYDLKSMACYLWGKGNDFTVRNMMELEFWGSDNQCPECGCEVAEDASQTHWEQVTPDSSPYRVGAVYKRCTNPLCDYEKEET